MKYITLTLLLACSVCQFACGQAVNPDLPELLTEISKICGDRWNVELADATHIHLNSKEKAIGEALGYNFGPGEKPYTLSFRFKIVGTFDGKAAEQDRMQLKKLRQEGNQIEHVEEMGYYHYYPKTQEQWSLVASIKCAEMKVDDIPEYSYKSIYLSEEYSMDFFIPKKGNHKAAQYKKDIEQLFHLLSKIAA